MLVVYVIEGNTLNSDKVFVVMSIVNTIRHTMTWLFPNSIAIFSELLVSCKRIQVIRSVWSDIEEEKEEKKMKT